MENKKTVLLGDEFDEKLIDSLSKSLQENGAILKNKLREIAGSQDYSCYEFVFQGAVLELEMETYFGVSVTGNESDVDAFLKILSE